MCLYDHHIGYAIDTRKFPFDLTVAKIEEKVLQICKNYDKISADKVFIWQSLCFLLQTTIMCTSKRNYSMPKPYTLEFIKKRVILVLQLYDKVDPEKVLLYVQFIISTFSQPYSGFLIFEENVIVVYIQIICIRYRKLMSDVLFCRLLSIRIS